LIAELVPHHEIEGVVRHSEALRFGLHHRVTLSRAFPKMRGAQSSSDPRKNDVQRVRHDERSSTRGTAKGSLIQLTAMPLRFD
jgi:hypothetical protein